MLRSAEAADGGAQRGQLDRDLLDLGRAGFGEIGCMGSRVEKQEPGTRVAADDRFNALAIEPAGGLDGFRAAEGRDVRIDEAAQTVGHAGSDPRKTRSAGGEDDGGLSGSAESLAGGGVGGVARLREGLAGDGQQAHTGGGQGIGG